MNRKKSNIINIWEETNTDDLQPLTLSEDLPLPKLPLLKTENFVDSLRPLVFEKDLDGISKLITNVTTEVHFDSSFNEYYTFKVEYNDYTRKSQSIIIESPNYHKMTINEVKRFITKQNEEYKIKLAVQHFFDYKSTLLKNIHQKTKSKLLKQKQQQQQQQPEVFQLCFQLILNDVYKYCYHELIDSNKSLNPIISAAIKKLNYTLQCNNDIQNGTFLKNVKEFKSISNIQALRSYCIQQTNPDQLPDFFPFKFFCNTTFTNLLHINQAVSAEKTFVKNNCAFLFHHHFYMVDFNFRTFTGKAYIIGMLPNKCLRKLDHVYEIYPGLKRSIQYIYTSIKSQMKEESLFLKRNTSIIQNTDIVSNPYTFYNGFSLRFIEQFIEVKKMLNNTNITNTFTLEEYLHLLPTILLKSLLLDIKDKNKTLLESSLSETLIKNSIYNSTHTIKTYIPDAFSNIIKNKYYCYANEELRRVFQDEFSTVMFYETNYQPISHENSPFHNNLFQNISILLTYIHLCTHHG